jgi:hypothetical protein
MFSVGKDRWTDTAASMGPAPDPGKMAGRLDLLDLSFFGLIDWVPPKSSSAASQKAVI